MEKIEEKKREEVQSAAQSNTAPAASVAKTENEAAGAGVASSAGTLRGALLRAILLAAGGIAVLWIAGKIFGNPENTQPAAIGYFGTPLLVVIVLVALLGRSAILRQVGKFGRALRLGWALPTAGIVLMVLNLTIGGSSLSAASKNTVWTYLTYLLTVTLGCAFEEILCRGLIQNELLAAAKRTGRSAWWAIVVSSAIFALMHLANLIATPQLVVATVTQVIYAFMIGVGFGVVYYRTGSLWGAITLHTLFNLFGQSAVLLSQGTAGEVTDLPLGGALVQLLVISPVFVVSWLQMRHSERAGVAQKVSSQH